MRQRFIRFPSLFSCFSMNWFLSWPAEALTEIAKHYVTDVLEEYCVKPLGDKPERTTVSAAEEQAQKEEEERKAIFANIAVTAC